MNIRIGLVQSPRELDIELADDADTVKLAEEITTAVAEGPGMFWLSDKKGMRVGIATGRVAYVEVGPEKDARGVGFKA